MATIFALLSSVPGPGLDAGTRRMTKMPQEDGVRYTPASTAPGTLTTPHLVTVTLGIGENRCECTHFTARGQAQVEKQLRPHSERVVGPCPMTSSSALAILPHSLSVVTISLFTGILTLVLRVRTESV